MNRQEWTCAQCGRRVPDAIAMCECGWPRLLSLEPPEECGEEGRSWLNPRQSGFALFLTTCVLPALALSHVGMFRHAAVPRQRAGVVWPAVSATIPPQVNEESAAGSHMLDPPESEPLYAPSGGGSRGGSTSRAHEPTPTDVTTGDNIDDIDDMDQMEARDNEAEVYEDERTAAEASWRERRQSAAAEAAHLTAQIEQRDAVLNDIRQNFIASSRADSLRALEEERSQLLAARQALEALDEEGRRFGFRP